VDRVMTPQTYPDGPSGGGTKPGSSKFAWNSIHKAWLRLARGRLEVKMFRQAPGMSLFTSHPRKKSDTTSRLSGRHGTAVTLMLIS